MDPVPSLDDLVWLFEREPSVATSDTDWQQYWPYASIAFATDREDYTVTVSLNPGYGDVAITIARGEHRLVELTVSDVRGADVEKLHGAEELVVRFRDEKLRPLRLRLKPRVSLSWGTELYPTDL